MKYDKINLILSLMTLAVCTLSSSNIAFCAERFVISIPSEKILTHLQNGKRILAYSIQLPNSEVYGLMKIPSDWIIRIDNYPPDRLKADAGHGVSYLTPDDIKNGVFKDFLIVQPSEGEGNLDIKASFEINIPLEEEPRILVIEKKDMIITPMVDTTTSCREQRA